MAKKHVLIEMRHDSKLEEAAVAAFSMAPFSANLGAGPESSSLPSIPGFETDPEYPPVPVPARTSPETRAAALSFSAPEGLQEATYLVRGTIDEGAVADTAASFDADSRVVNIYADPVIEPCMTCISTPAVGTHRDVASRLCVDSLRRKGMTGAGTLLAIVDTGINLAHLQARGLNPSISVARSWVPTVPAGSPPLVPFQLPVDHGTMCAFDALIAAPRATLVDIAVLRSRRTGGSAMDGLLSDAVLAYSFLLRILSGPRRPGDFHSLVVSNSWGMFNSSWDFPVGHPGNYSDNPNHPFNIIVGTLERTGADILFAAGNCGHECPDGRCGAERDAGIYGANSHAKVLSIAGVDINDSRVGYSTRGPGHLTPKKPDVAGYTHFAGSEVYPADGGTSAATPVVAGVVAAMRTRFPLSATVTPAVIRSVIRATAKRGGGPEFTNELGFGIVNACKLATVTRLTPPPSFGVADGDDGLDIEFDQPQQPIHQEIGMTTSDQEFLAALAAFDQPAAFAAAPAVTAAPVDVCGTYKKVRPILAGILPFLKAIPVFGAKAATAIQALMAALDVVCPQGGGPVSFAASAAAGDREFLQAISAFDPGMQTADFAASPFAAAPSLSDVCSIYKKVKPILNGILPFLGLIPHVGAPAAGGIKALMTVLDTICP